MLPLFTVLHPLVDALSISIVLCTATGWTAFFVYNSFAFALQFPLGLALDRFPELTRPAFGSGLGLLAAGTVLRLLDLGELLPIGIVCSGNALFHLTAGKLVLDRTEGRAGPVGLFISTGAAGLMAGRLLTDSFPQALPIAITVLLLSLGGVALARVPFSVARRCVPRMKSAADWILTVVLFAFVVWRGRVALSAAGGDADSLCVLLLGAGVTLAGKIAGGYVADAVGRWPVVAVSVIGSLLMWFGVGIGTLAVWMGVMFLAQLATGPVLSLLHGRLGGSSGSSFGLNCLGLFMGMF